MSRLYACIISSKADEYREILLAIAGEFSYSIEMIEDGVLFDVSGLERLIGKPPGIAQKILELVRGNNIEGSIAVADTIRTAELLARQKSGTNTAVHLPEEFDQLPLRGLGMENDTLKVFRDLGIDRVRQLLDIPQEELIGRYGRQFQSVIDAIRQKGERLLTPNIKEKKVSWNCRLDHPVEDFEQLIFVLNHGLDLLFSRVADNGSSTEHLDISFDLDNRTAKSYEIRTSFPTLDKAFWLKLTNLRISLDPPVAEIVAVNVTAHFTKPRPSQTGLYAVSRPEPESLLLTADKLKKLAGQENVGVPVILDQRLDKTFAIDVNKLPSGSESCNSITEKAVIAFSYFDPPMRAEVLIREKRLIFVRTKNFSGRVLECSGVWRANSKWWESSWKTEEWDIEIENYGVYRLCKAGGDWFIAGEYD